MPRRDLVLWRRAARPVPMQRTRPLERSLPGGRSATSGWRSAVEASGGIEMALATPAELEGEGPPIAPGGVEAAEVGRTGIHLPWRQLFVMSVYWFGIQAIWGGYETFGQEQVKLMVGEEQQGPHDRRSSRASGRLMALVVQPTAGAISDYTSTRWGRRKALHHRRLGHGRHLPRRSRPHRDPEPGQRLGRPGAGDDADGRALRRPLPLPPVQLEHGPGPVPGLPARPRPGAPGRRRRARSSGS